MQPSVIELCIYIYGIGKLNQKNFSICIIIFIAVQRNTVVTVVREKKKDLSERRPSGYTVPPRK